MILHIVKQSKLSDRLLETCFAAVAQEDALVFTDVNEEFLSREYPFAKQLFSMSKTNQMYLLDESAETDNMHKKYKTPSFLKTITMDQFVELTAQFAKSQSWF